MSRTSKQVTYGSLYIGSVALIIFGIYFIFFRTIATCSDGKQNRRETGIDCGGDCISCEIKALKPLSASQPIILRSGETITVISDIRNLNQRYGTDQIKYAIHLYDIQNNLIQSLARETFVYAGGVAYVIEAGISDRRGIIAKAEIAIEDPIWQSSTEWKAPSIETKNISVSLQQDIFVIDGTVKNLNNSTLRKATIGVFVYNTLGQKSGASQTTLEQLGPFEERPFRVFVAPDDSLRATIDTKETVVVVEAR